MYRWRLGATDDDIRRLRMIFIAWQPPKDMEIIGHYHFATGGGVVIVHVHDSATLQAAMAPFTPIVEFDVEPVVSPIEATAIAMEADEWTRAVGKSDTDR